MLKMKTTSTSEAGVAHFTSEIDRRHFLYLKGGPRFKTHSRVIHSTVLRNRKLLTSIAEIPTERKPWEEPTAKTPWRRLKPSIKRTGKTIRLRVSNSTGRVSRRRDHMMSQYIEEEVEIELATWQEGPSLILLTLLHRRRMSRAVAREAAAEYLSLIREISMRFPRSSRVAAKKKTFMSLQSLQECSENHFIL